MAMAIRVAPDGSIREIPDIADLVPAGVDMTDDDVMDVVTASIALDWVADQGTAIDNAGMNPDTGTIVFAHGAPNMSPIWAKDHPDAVRINETANLPGDAAVTAVGALRADGASHYALYGPVWVLGSDGGAFTSLTPEVIAQVRAAVEGAPVSGAAVACVPVFPDMIAERTRELNDEDASGADETPAQTITTPDRR